MNEIYLSLAHSLQRRLLHMQHHRVKHKIIKDLKFPVLSLTAALHFPKIQLSAGPALIEQP